MRRAGRGARIVVGGAGRCEVAVRSYRRNVRGCWACRADVCVRMRKRRPTSSLAEVLKLQRLPARVGLAASGSDRRALTRELERMKQEHQPPPHRRILRILLHVHIRRILLHVHIHRIT